MRLVHSPLRLGLAALDNELRRRDRGDVRAAIKAQADSLSDLPRLVRLAERLQQRFRRAYLDALARVRNTIDVQALEQAIEAQQITGAEVASQFESFREFGPQLQAQLRQAAMAGGMVGAEAMAEGGFAISFDLINPWAVAFARTRGAELLTGPDNLIASMREGIREIIGNAFEQGIDPARTARLIRQEALGLDQRRAQTLNRFEDRLIEQELPENTIERRTLRYANSLNRSRAETIARTEILSASNEGQRELWREAQRQGIIDKEFTYQQWIVTWDERLEEECEAVADEEVPLGEQFSNGEDGPPLHPNSIAGWIPVEGQALVATRMSYTGKIREIVTASGRTLAVTPNHAVATLRGFIPAHQLQEGEYLLAYDEGIKDDRPAGSSVPPTPPVLTPPQDNQHRPAPIQEVFHAFLLTGKLIRTERRGDEFHGDAAYGNGEIEIVLANGELRLDDESARPDQVPRLRLESTDRSFPRHRDPLQMESRVLLAEPVIRPADLSPALPPQTRRIGATARLDAALLEMRDQFRTRDACYVRELQDRLPGLVSQDQIVEIRDRNYSGHVYDLQTISEVIVAQGLIISNCRCTLGLTFRYPDQGEGDQGGAEA